jgi:hypothetical protein
MSQRTASARAGYPLRKLSADMDGFNLARRVKLQPARHYRGVELAEHSQESDSERLRFGRRSRVRRRARQGDYFGHHCPFGFFPHRAAAPALPAFRAMSLRCCEESEAARASPPFLAPSFDSAAAARLFCDFFGIQSSIA